MSSKLTRRGLILAASATVAGCGFSPAFGTNGPASVLNGAVAVTAPDTAFGFQMRSRITDRLGAATSPRFDLTIIPKTSSEAAAVNPDGNTTRFQISGSAGWSLTESGASHGSGTVQGFVSYSATGSTVATQTAALDAATRLATILADAVVTDVILAAMDLP